MGLWLSTVGVALVSTAARRGWSHAAGIVSRRRCPKGGAGALRLPDAAPLSSCARRA
jgi:hypothetical protein